MRRILIAILLLVLASPGYAEMSGVTASGVAVGGAAAGGTETIGNDDLDTGDSTSPLTTGKVMCSAMDAPANTGTLDKISILSGNSVAGQDIKVGIYQDNAGVPGTKIGTETEFPDTGTWSAGWKEFAVSYAVTASTNYWLCFETSGNLTIYYVGGAAGSRHWDTNTYGDAWSASYSSASNSNSRYGLKANVTY